MKSTFLLVALLAFAAPSNAQTIIVLEPAKGGRASYAYGFDQNNNVYGVSVGTCFGRNCQAPVESCTWDGTGAAAVKANGGFWTVEAPISCAPGGVLMRPYVPMFPPPETVLYLDSTTNAAVGFAGVSLYGQEYVVATRWNPDGTLVQWLPAGTRSQGWDSLFYAIGVTDGGAVCGVGIHDSGGYRGFLVVQ